MSEQTELFPTLSRPIPPFRPQLLKWVGNKQRFAHEIASYFPDRFGTYYEPFLGSGGVLATLAPKNAIASDAFEPLIKLFETLKRQPATLKHWYTRRWRQMAAGDKREEYERIKASYNRNPNPADLLFLSRSCYGGVVRFRKADGNMSTPVGVHAPISTASFAQRVDLWHRRTRGTTFLRQDYRQSMRRAKRGDLVYCDPPYSHSQAILYGAQGFNLEELFDAITDCKQRGVFVALSIDGTKRSGLKQCDLPIPIGLFEREVYVDCGRSMLKRFQMEGKSLHDDRVADRLLLTY